MLVRLNAAKCIGIEAVNVKVEVDIASGIGIHIVGLVDVAVKESLLRTVTALQAVGYKIPGKKIVINLAPADLRKSGSGYDLPIAIGIIAASQQEEFPLVQEYLIMGELGLDASVRPIPGSLIFCDLSKQMGLRACILPEASAREAAFLFADIPVYGVRTLTDVVRILVGEEDVSDLLANRSGSASDSPATLYPDCPPASIGSSASPAFSVNPCSSAPPLSSASPGFSVNPCSSAPLMSSASPSSPETTSGPYPDFSEIAGQEMAKRGAEIALAGGHNIIMVGPPGSGKSLLAKAMAGIMPPLSETEALTVCKLYSVAGKGFTFPFRCRPFRSPHYSASIASMIGGGSSDNVLPGEITLAHNGILFLDEFAQMPKSVIEALRGPLEDRKVSVSRLRLKVEYPASFMLVAASNPCPCGYYGDSDRCTCTPSQRLNYLSKLSGPIMDRIDIQLRVARIRAAELVGNHGKKTPPPERSADVARRVALARQIQLRRFEGSGISTNAEMSDRQMALYCQLSDDCVELMERLIDRMSLSARAYSRIRRIARTICDLEAARQTIYCGSDEIPIPGPIRAEHIAEAVSFRFLDRREIAKL
ncbi:MAG: YifB family Mg chelatase-like AAA ATPase [Candidatus Cryptobacteroides sp.]|nr:YifB family Mg chelatase-like AAA ATPase [Candidatus Cryptobacteroides sp.]